MKVEFYKLVARGAIKSNGLCAVLKHDRRNHWFTVEFFENDIRSVRVFPYAPAFIVGPRCHSEALIAATLFANGQLTHWN